MPLTILVVDDDPGTRISISDYLELSGYIVVAAENGHKALTLVEQYRPHLIVTDITMPEMDGYELVRQVRRQPAFRLLPVIFLTARTNTEERIRGYQLGCDLYLPKPFDLDELGAIIRNLLERSQLIQTEWRLRSQPTEAEKSYSAEHDPNSPHSGLQDTNHAGIKLPSPAIALQVALTPRERDVLDLLAAGMSNAQIGDRLHLSPRTVEKYVSSLLRKTDSNNRAELVRFAMEHHLVE